MFYKRSRKRAVEGLMKNGDKQKLQSIAFTVIFRYLVQSSVSVGS